MGQDCEQAYICALGCSHSVIKKGTWSLGHGPFFIVLFFGFVRFNFLDSIHQKAKGNDCFLEGSSLIFTNRLKFINLNIAINANVSFYGSH